LPNERGIHQWSQSRAEIFSLPQELQLELFPAVYGRLGPPGHKLKVVVAGGHPGDPEAACGGTMSRMVDMGQEVLALYVTRGEAGIKGKTRLEAGAIRTEEAKKACELLKVRAMFANQTDGANRTHARPL
jgi:LmbE family N-acetylglucosaminyl deacetylase